MGVSGYQLQVEPGPGVLGNDVVKSLMKSLEMQQIISDMPAGFRGEVGGNLEKSNENTVYLAVCLSMSIILLLVIQYNGWIRPIIILTTLPLALIGALSALYLTDNRVRCRDGASLGRPDCSGAGVQHHIPFRRSAHGYDDVFQLRHADDTGIRRHHSRFHARPHADDGEAFIGQLYLVVLVAQLVGLHISTDMEMRQSVDRKQG